MRYIVFGGRINDLTRLQLWIRMAVRSVDHYLLSGDRPQTLQRSCLALNTQSQNGMAAQQQQSWCKYEGISKFIPRTPMDLLGSSSQG